MWSRTAAGSDGSLFTTASFGSAVALPNGGLALSVTYSGDGTDGANIDFGDGALAVVPPGQQSAAFVAAYDDAGTALFARSVVQAAPAGARDPSGVLGLGVAAADTLYAGAMGAANAYVVALSLDGSTKWATKLDGVEASALAVRPGGGVVVSATCEDDCDFAGGFNHTSADPLVLFRLDDSGNIVATGSFGPGPATSDALAVDPSGAIFVAAVSTARSLSRMISNAGQSDILLARLAPLLQAHARSGHQHVHRHRPGSSLLVEAALNAARPTGTCAAGRDPTRRGRAHEVTCLDWSRGHGSVCNGGVWRAGRRRRRGGRIRRRR